MREEMNASFEHMQDFVKVTEVRMFFQWRRFSIVCMDGILEVYYWYEKLY
jgi:hypothetical protein